MATQMAQLLWRGFDDLRVHPVRKRVRAMLGDHTLVDTRAAQLVWEPRRVVGCYAVPEADLLASLVVERSDAAEENPVSLEDGRRVLDPRTPFASHSTPGMPLTIRTPDAELPGAAFRAEDPDLAGYVLLDWHAFTGWLEEDEPVTAHPRDPFHRIDCLRSSQHVQLSFEGVVVADSTRPTVLFETNLPPRFYLPRDDVAMDLLERTASTSVCAYKGQACYWSIRHGETLVPDMAWSYEEPLNDAVPVRGLIAFYTERLDLRLDGVAQPRPRTPWS